MPDLLVLGHERQLPDAQFAGGTQRSVVSGIQVVDDGVCARSVPGQQDGYAVSIQPPTPCAS